MMRHWTKIISYGVLAATGSLLVGGCARDGEFSPVDMWNRSRYKPYEANPILPNGNSSQPLVPGTVYRGQVEQDALFPPGMVSGTYDGNGARTSADMNNSRSGAGGLGASTPDGARAGNVRDDGAAPAMNGGTGAPAAGGPNARIPQQTGAVDPIYLGPGAQMTSFPIKVDATVIRRGKVQYDIYCTPCHARDGYGNGMVVQRGFAQPPSFHSDRLREAPVGHYFEVITNGYGAMYSYANRVKPKDRWAIIAYIRALQLSQNASLNDVPVAERGQLKTMPVPEGVMPKFLDNPAVPGNVTRGSSRDVGSTPGAARQPARAGQQ